MEYSKRPLWQKIFIYLVIGGIVYWFVYYFYFVKSGSFAKSESNKYTYSPAASQATQISEDITGNVILYSDTGFSPKSLTIKPNATVTFKNESGKSMWVASNPHPIHSDYSAFDAKRGYKKEESYQFTFTEAGEYIYHNHLSPNDEGTITVE